MFLSAYQVSYPSTFLFHATLPFFIASALNLVQRQLDALVAHTNHSFEPLQFLAASGRRCVTVNKSLLRDGGAMWSSALI